MVAITSIVESIDTVPKTSLPELVILGVPLNLYLFPSEAGVWIVQIEEDNLYPVVISHFNSWLKEPESTNDNALIIAFADVLYSFSLSVIEITILFPLTDINFIVIVVKVDGPESGVGGSSPGFPYPSFAEHVPTAALYEHPDVVTQLPSVIPQPLPVQEASWAAVNEQFSSSTQAVLSEFRAHPSASPVHDASTAGV